MRKELTDEWGAARHQARTGVRHADRHYHAGLVGYDDAAVQAIQRIETESLRDNMTNLELVLNMLAEGDDDRKFSKERRPRTFAANRIVAAQGGRIAGNTRREIEAQTGKKDCLTAQCRTGVGGERNRTERGGEGVTAALG